MSFHDSEFSDIATRAKALASARPCPFCGADHTRFDEYAVVCDACGATGPCGEGKFGGQLAEYKYAVKLWNYRGFA